MGSYVDVVVKLTRSALFKRFEIVEARDELTDAPVFSIGGLPIQFCKDAAAICTLHGPGLTVQQALQAVEEAVPGLVDDLEFERIAVTLENDGLSPTTRFSDLARMGVAGAELLGVRHKPVGDVLLPPGPPAAPSAAADWLDTIEVDGDGQLRQSSPEEQDLEAKAEAFLQSMNRDAILAALRSQRDDD